MPALSFHSAFYSRKADRCLFRYTYPERDRWAYGDELRDGVHPSFETSTFTAVDKDMKHYCSDNVKSVSGGCPRTLDAYIETLR